MTRFHFERPDGTSRGQNILEHLNEFVPPQGYGGHGISPSVEEMAYEVAWFNISFLKRIPLTINVSQVPSTQTNFPLLINGTFSDLIGFTLAELRFAGIDNVQLEYEIQKFDSITGELIAWVKMPTISDGDIVNIYYDNPSAIDEQNSSAVWDVNYKSVYHGQTDGTDSTGNNQDLTQFGTVQTPVPGKIGNGMDFNETVNDYSIRNPYAGFPLNELTAEFWIKTVTSGEGIISYAVGTGGPDNHFLILGQEDLDIYIVNSLENTGMAIDDNVFHHFVITWRSSDGAFIVYIDGVLDYTATHRQGFSFTDNGSLVLGQDQDNVGGGFSNAQALNGILDEIRLSDNFRSADYVETSFNNQDNPGAFYATGAEENVPALVDMEYEDGILMEYEN